ncbi:hypothetical protein CDL15_Pgr002459 [Punica granatum]|uniref:Transcription factor MYB102-like n=1 Tax=Punica granatum TaxID=22663 RepID=A0A218XWN2_PUNGR|nr:hypothetical protein CDL15_Pgr002459 [Punica granatum]
MVNNSKNVGKDALHHHRGHHQRQAGTSPSCASSEKTASNDGLKKGPWTADEDQKLIDYIKKHGHGRWRTLPKNAGLKRCGKSCRLRWTNYLRPDIKRGRFSSEEEEAIIQLHSILGNKWSAIAARLPGRTDNEIKNYWNTHIKKRLLRMGIDPVTHAPRLDVLELSSILSSSLYNYTHYPNIPNLLGWSAIAARLPGRTDNEIKNYWNTHIKKRLLRMGIDPVTHAPRLDVLELSSILSSSLYNYTHYPNIPNLLGLIGSSSLNQNKDFLEIAKQLVISQNISREGPPNYIEPPLAHHLQNQNQDQHLSANPISIGDQYYSLPSSSWDNSYGGFGFDQNLMNSSLLGADQGSFDIGNDSNGYVGLVQSLIDPNSNFQDENVNIKEVQRLGVAGSSHSSPMSNNSGCTFNSSSTTTRTRTYGASGTCNNEDERDTYGSNSSMYDIINHVSSYVNSIM